MKKFLAIALLSSVLFTGVVVANDEGTEVAAASEEVAGNFVTRAVKSVWNLVPFTGRVTEFNDNHPTLAKVAVGSALATGGVAVLYKYCPCFKAKVDALFGITKTRSAKAYL